MLAKRILFRSLSQSLSVKTIIMSYSTSEVIDEPNTVNIEQKLSYCNKLSNRIQFNKEKKKQKSKELAYYYIIVIYLGKRKDKKKHRNEMLIWLI